MEGSLHRLVEKLAEEYLGFLARLVQEPTVLGAESAGQWLIKERLCDLGLFEREVRASNEPPFVPTSRSYEDRPCVVGKLEGTGTAHFILNAHIDTAPVEDPDSWQHPPFAAEVSEGKMFGRGALDDKAGLAMMLLIADCFQRAGIRLPGNLYFESVIEDEDSGNGTLACTRAGYYADAAIVIDGTWPFRVIDTHLGQVWLRYEIKGPPVAACVCGRGANPIHHAYEVIKNLEEYVAEGNRRCPEWQSIARPYFVNVGKLHSGCWAGSVPEKCDLEVQLGFPPPSTPEQVIEEASGRARSLEKADARISVKSSPGSLRTPAFSNRGNKMVQTLARTIHRLRPGEREVLNQAVTGHCDLRHFRTPDGKPAAACLYGPGGGGNPHGRDEFYHLEHFVPVAQNICSAILEWYQME